jgi:phosphatidylserine/phosphatidylglycerophosphate/cardiolipin synthase-like enzyme
VIVSAEPTEGGGRQGGARLEAVDPALETWFLPMGERGNDDSAIDRRRGDGRPYTLGNQVDVLVHGRVYFARLHACLSGLRPGDAVGFADWRGDPDQDLVDGAPLASVLAGLAERGVHVRGLVWRSHPKVSGFHEEHHVELARRVNEAGGLILLDQRVRSAGSHHQKLVLLRHAGRPHDDVAFVGGIDICHGRRDDARHLGDPQVEELDDGYGDRPPWHDVQLTVSGPAVGDLDLCFRERWDDPAPLSDRRNPWRIWVSRLAKQPERRDPIPEQSPDPGPCGPHAVQVLRTYPRKRPPYPFARQGERSIVRAYRRVFDRATCLIYVEDQYFWSRGVADLFASALERSPELRVMVVVPRVPDRNGPLTGPAHGLPQRDVIRRLTDAGGDRFAMYDLENEDGTPIYVHAKTVVVDDVWAEVGSDNLNRRSWTHDSELSVAVLDERRDPRRPTDPGGGGEGARVFARDLRIQLMREHLGDVDADLADPIAAFDAARDAAGALESWHADGRLGLRPPGRLRPHRAPAVRWWMRPWGRLMYHTLVDPDGRPASLRRHDRY